MCADLRGIGWVWQSRLLDKVKEHYKLWRDYFIGKLFEINYRMAIHEGDANRRLASEAAKILILPPSEIPERYKNEFDKLRRLIGETLKGLSATGLTPTKLKKIRNSTASKYESVVNRFQ